MIHETALLILQMNLKDRRQLFMESLGRGKARKGSFLTCNLPSSFMANIKDINLDVMISEKNQTFIIPTALKGPALSFSRL
jgi:hypothetical protein